MRIKSEFARNIISKLNDITNTVMEMDEKILLVESFSSQIPGRSIRSKSRRKRQILGKKRPKEDWKRFKVQLLVKAMEEKNFTVKRLARKIHVSVAAIRNWFSGRSIPSTDIARRLKEVLGTDGFVKKGVTIQAGAEGVKIKQ